MKHIEQISYQNYFVSQALFLIHAYLLLLRGTSGLTFVKERIFRRCVVVLPFGEMIGDIESSIVVGTIFEVNEY